MDAGFQEFPLEIQEQILARTYDVFHPRFFFSLRLICRAWDQMITTAVKSPLFLLSLLTRETCLLKQEGSIHASRLLPLKYDQSQLSKLIRESRYQDVLRPILVHRMSRLMCDFLLRSMISLNPCVRVLKVDQVENIIRIHHYLLPGEYTLDYQKFPEDRTLMCPNFAGQTGTLTSLNGLVTVDRIFIREIL